MRLQTVFHLLLLVFLCLTALWSAVHSESTTSPAPREYVCVDNKKNSRQKKQDNFSVKALEETTQTRSYLSPTVFLGTLRSVLVQRDGTVTAWFRVDKSLKHSRTGPTGNETAMVNEDVEVVYFRNGEHRCVLEVNQDNMRLGSQYLVFGGDTRTNTWTSLTATALPIPNDKRILRAAKKILCKDCAKPPSLSGLQKMRIEEGSRVRLNCHLAGNPIPWVEWYKDGVKVADRGRVWVKTKKRTSRLVIRHARPADRGVYECRAGNLVRPHPPVTLTAALAVTRKRKKKPVSTIPPTPPTTAFPTPPNPWATEPCPTSDFCLNGGTCVFYRMVREYVCKCAEGYVGQRCDYKDVSISVGEVKNYSSRGDIP